MTKSGVGLANVDNTTDLLKPLSTASINALALKAPLANPTFTGIVAANALNVTTDLTCGTLTCQTLYGGVIAQLKTNILSSPSITGTLTAPLLSTGRITASSGNREGGLAWTGIIAMNTANQEILYTDNARNTNFRGNVVIDGICAPASIQCTNGATVGGTLTVEQNSVFLGPVSLTSTLTLPDIKLSGSAGLNILKSDGSSAVKIDAEVRLV